MESPLPLRNGERSRARVVMVTTALAGAAFREMKHRRIRRMVFSLRDGPAKASASRHGRCIALP